MRDRTKPSLIEVLAFLIEKGPGRTEAELAKAIYARAGYQQRVNEDCRILADSGRVERRGGGQRGDPYRYYPKTNHRFPVEPGRA